MVADCVKHGLHAIQALRSQGRSTYRTVSASKEDRFATLNDSSIIQVLVGASFAQVCQGETIHDVGEAIGWMKR